MTVSGELTHLDEVYDVPMSRSLAARLTPTFDERVRRGLAAVDSSRGCR
eukprot:CAMPEP_0119323174 /NCGR_PEP_ID=MMETSP1333-20130426/60219_1 /TAXON_ID=418940 /ORGANISM="Scyphosphaera apsteinii, Strain RCC1455" /LENGTH=48 /DNA_ID= /DNA_START= /DNA_END= /DNA_ORIENTATION=